MKKLNSIFGDTDRCLVTGMETGIERHHIFEGLQGFKKKSEKYGFIVGVHKSLHPNGAFLKDKNWVDLDHWLKRMCQEYYIDVAHIGDRNDWYREFGRFYDDRTDEKVWLNGQWEWRKEDENGKL